MVAAGEQTLLKESADVRAALGGLARDRRVGTASAQTVERLMNDVIANERSLAALKLQLAARVAESHGAKAAEDLARKAGTSKSKAKGTLETAKKLKDQPEVQDALCNGELSEDQASLVADAASVNPSATGSLLKKAKDHPINDLKDACSRAKAAADDDEEATHHRVHKNRYLRTGTNTDPAFWGSIYGTTADGADFMAHFQPFRDQVFKRNKDAGVRDSAEQMDYDALMEMARAAYANVTGQKTSAPDGGDEAIPMPATTPKAPKTVYIVANFDAMVGRAQPGEESAYIAGFGPVPISVVREAMNDAFLVGVVVHGTEVAKIRRFGRRFGEEIRDAVMIKHRFRCSTPGCTNWANLELDHVHPYGRDGPTDYTNCKPKCTPCHRLKTEQDRLFWDSS